MARFRVAVIGHTGRGDYGHGLDTVWQHVPDCQLVAVADADDAGRARAMQRLSVTRGYVDYRQMLDEVRPDIVSVAPRWLDQHRDMVVAAAERGSHIYLEKPMCRSLTEADEMVAAIERHKVKLAVAFQTRYSPKLPLVRQLLEDGRIGDVLELRGRGKEDARGGGEDLWVLGSHVMNLIHHLAGEPQWCFAQVEEDRVPIERRHVRPGAEGIGPLAGDRVQAMFAMADGVTAYFGSRRHAAGERFGVQVFGTRGVLEILTGYLPQIHLLEDPRWSPGRGGAKWVPVSSQGVDQPEPLEDGGLHAGNVLACQDLLHAIEHDRQPEASVYEGRMTIAMISSVFESQRLGRPVPFPLTTRENPLTLL